MNGTEQVRLSLPESLRRKLMEFRKRVWTVKSIESLAIAVLGIFVAFLAVYLLDRFFDTPSQLRGLLLAAALLVCCVLPWAAYQWIWRKRRLDQLALLLRHKHPSVGDQLLGIIELVDNDEEQARSRELCEAAVKQVAEEAETRDLTNAVPNPRHKLFAGLAGGGALATLILLCYSPVATGNAWSRFLMPWRDTPRYTFTMIETQDDSQVVPHGEVFPFEVRLKEESRWHPDTAQIQLAGSEPIVAKLIDNAYHFDCPPQLADTTASLKVGDYSQQLAIEPKLRPELTEILAEIELPKYLKREENLVKDVRSGSGTFVVGSRAKLTAKASRELESATINGVAGGTSGSGFTSNWLPIEENQTLSIAWKDNLQLTGPKAFELTLNSREDGAPSIVCEGLQRQRVVLDSETLQFNVRGVDDFGIKRIGIEWKGFDTTMTSQPAQGERLLGAGSPTNEELNVAGTFCAKSLGISPQPLHLRMFAEDYLPDRERVYSPIYTLYILSPEDHAIWLTDQLSKWHRHSLNVRDKELQLYEKNKQLRDMEAAKLDDPNTRREIERQAAGERTNGRRLNRLTSIGEDLVKQASRNSEFGVGHLEKWAEMLQTLKDISSNRMPSVADLLKDAAKSEQLASVGGKPNKQEAAPQAGQNRMPPGKPGASEGDGKKKPTVPSIVDSESSQQQPDPDAEPSEPAPSKSGSPRLTLPVTTLAGKAKDGGACPAGEKMDEAVTEQRDLLNEFEKITEELNKVLANLEGSTLVKRLKAVSRTEYKIAGRIGDNVDDAFGLASISKDDVKTLFTSLGDEQTETTQKVSYIMDDMQAYYERRRMAKFKSILDEMENQDVLGALRDISDEMSGESGVTITQCEFWSDTIDRWAEDLVDPAGGGT